VSLNHRASGELVIAYQPHMVHHRKRFGPAMRAPGRGRKIIPSLLRPLCRGCVENILRPTQLLTSITIQRCSCRDEDAFAAPILLGDAPFPLRARYAES